MPESSTGKIRILIVEDQALFAHMLKTVLETRAEDFSVVAIASDGLEALELAERHDPDVVLLDLSLPVMDGVRAAKALLQRNPSLRVLILTTFDDQSAVQETVQAGVVGYILKDCEPEALFAAIRTVHSGASSFAQGILKKLLDPRHHSEPVQDKVPLPSLDYLEGILNRREREIMVLAAEGLENKEIADRLFIAEQTVKNNISRLYEKLDIKDRGKLVKIAAHYAAFRLPGR
jgi:DNA-binding NarL/FixJ family response regulator